MGSQEAAKEDRDEGIGRELDYYATFAQNADFRQFVRKLSRCRSIASLDVENVSKRDSNDDTIEDEKGKGNKSNTINNTTSPNNRTNSNDDHINLKDYKTSSSQIRSRKQAINTWSGEEEPTGRGDTNYNIKKTQRPYSDIYGEFPNQLQKSTSSSNVDSNFDFSKESSGNYSSMSLPRRNKRASVILKERHQSMMMIQEGQEMARTGVFTLPRVSCYHRSTR